MKVYSSDDRKIRMKGETMEKKKQFRNRVHQAALIALFSGLSTHSGAYTTNFHACYTGTVDTVSNDVVRATGSTNVTVLFTNLCTNVTYEINPVTLKNEGIAVGTNQVSLSYATAGNLSTTSGTVEIWFKPIDWNPTTNNNCVIFQTANSSTPPAKFYIYKTGLSGITAYFTTNGTTQISISKTITNWQNHIYHHVVATYNVKGDMELYVDGVKAGSQAIGTASSPAVSWPATFTIGPATAGFGRNSQTAIERVRIYDNVLSSNEIQNLAARTEFNQVLGTFSKWFQIGRPKLGTNALSKNVVPPPWTNVAYNTSDATATCWNRTYDFSGSDILKNVSSGTNALLSEPVQLHMTVGGSGGFLSLGAPAIVANDSGTGRCVFVRTGSIGSISASLRYTLEYDGLLWCDLTLQAPTPSSLQELTLETFLKKDIAQLTHYVGAPTNFMTQNSPSNSYSKAIPYTENLHHMSGLKSMVWIGNNQHGLLWCTESDQYWYPKDRDDCILIDRQENGDVILTVKMITNALPANAPTNLNYRFGLMATPIKPLPKGWRAWTHTDQVIGRTNELRGKNVIYWPDYRFMLMDHDPTRYPATNISLTKTLIAIDMNAGNSIIPYWTRTNIRTENNEDKSITDTNHVTKLLREASLMTREWTPLPNNDPGTTQYRLSASTEWSDYLVWSLEEFATNVMGHADGVYLDEVQPIPNSRAESGGGYDDFDGTRRPTFEMFATRNLLKRLAYNTWQRNPTNTARTIAHCSGTQTANALGAFNLWLMGENYNCAYFDDWYTTMKLLPPTNNPAEEAFYYSYVMPMDRVRAECYPQQWGEVILFLPQFKGYTNTVVATNMLTNPAATRDMLSRVMQADVVVWPFLCNAAEVHKTWAFRRNFDIGNTNVTFTPYWEDGKKITASRISPYQGWWTFNAATGAAAVDSSGYGNHATLINMISPSCWTNGIAGKALYFSNSAGYVDCGTNVAWDTMTSYTVSCWLKPATSNINNRGLIDAHTNNSGFFMDLNNVNQLSAFQSVDGNPTLLGNCVPFPHDQKFHHVAVTFSYGSNCASTLKTYIDGSPKVTNSLAGVPDLDPVRTTIGRGAFAGIIDDVKIHSCALSDSEVNNEFSNSLYQSVWLKFNDAYGTNAVDSSSYGLNGHLTNMNLTAAWSNKNSIRFSGVSTQYVNCGVSPEFSATNYTVELWVKPDMTASNVNTRHLVETRSANSGFYMQLYTNAELYTYQSVTGNIYAVAGHVAFPHDGMFHHAAMTFNYDGTNSTLKTYLDGVLKVTKTAGGRPDLTQPGIPLKIGEGSFSGNIRDFKFHTRVLTDTDIAASAAQSDMAIAQAPYPDVVTGYYSKTNEYLVLVSNLSRQPCAVKVDFEGLSITNATDAETTNNLSHSNGYLILKMNRNDYRALLLK
jgi:hypothetical protein